ncbi:MAG: TRAP transporter fused permease subunit [Pseudomonadota bacterium]|nr:TRAP transporter fused permease subunit [Pseudomonadota bacterium]
MNRALYLIGACIAAILAVHAIYVAFVGQYIAPEFIRSGMLFLSALVVVLTQPLAETLGKRAAWLVPVAWIVDAALLANLGYACWLFLDKIADIESLMVIYTTIDKLSALIAVLTLLELTRRIFGLVLASVGLLGLLFCFFGASLPGVLRHSGFSLEQTLEIVWFGMQGIFGVPLGIVVLLIFIFIVFGALLDGTGAGNTMIRMALAATARTRGGPANSAIVASSVFGMSSGSVVANVVGTGVVTIPLIKRRGFSPAFAGGVAAAASTGGQIMPPVMGAAAFLMAGLVGLPYQSVAIAALIPALFYYANLFIVVNLEARRIGLEPTLGADRPRIEPGDWRKSLAFFLPVAAIIGTLAMGRSASMAGFWAVVVTIVTGLIVNPELRRDPKRIFKALAEGGMGGARILVAVGTIGMLIAVFNLTGVGIKFAGTIASLGNESVFIALLLTAASCLVLGMGMPTLPAYLIIVLVLGTALRRMGLPDLPVHLFVFYFGVLSAVTPPVALAAFAAAPIAKAEPIRTGLAAMKLSLVGFVIPFIFVTDPTILLVVEEFSAPALVYDVLRVGLVIWMLATAMIGYEAARISMPLRLLRVAAGFALATPFVEAQIAAGVASVLMIGLHRWQARSATPQRALRTTDEAA